MDRVRLKYKQIKINKCYIIYKLTLFLQLNSWCAAPFYKMAPVHDVNTFIKDIHILQTKCNMIKMVLFDAHVYST